MYGSIFGAETAPVPQKLHLAGVDLVTHTELILHKSGIHTDCAIPYVATSPDGIFICKCYDPLVVEVKCLHRLKEMTINDYIDTLKDTCLFPDHTTKETHAYYHQVQLQMYVTKLNKCHFVVWSPTEVSITVVERDNTFITDMLSTCITFFKSVVLPELITRRLEMQLIDKPKMIHTTDMATDKK